jgi:predicted nucleotide-binding protein
MEKKLKCFLVHGHNEKFKYEVSRFLSKELKIDVTILHEELNYGKTIIEKFEKFSDVDFVVTLWSADDWGRKKGLKKRNGKIKNNHRARQNVIFETGYFIGKLGREKVIVLYDMKVEIPSDYHGVLYIPLRDNWKFNLQEEIKRI